ncbi:hypothetical protein ACJW30_07G075700 [Castanea mollissima]
MPPWSCIKVALNFVSLENVGVCICLTEELHTLPQNHRAKVDKLEGILAAIDVFFDHALAGTQPCI